MKHTKSKIVNISFDVGQRMKLSSAKIVRHEFCFTGWSVVSKTVENEFGAFHPLIIQLNLLESIRRCTNKTFYIPHYEPTL